VSGTS